MFQNLYFIDNTFRNHNFSDFFVPSKPFEQVEDDWIEHQIRESFELNEPLEPYFWSILPYTLSSLCCSAFLRSNPGLPITERDYLLSKLFQFVYATLQLKYLPLMPQRHGRPLDISDEITEALDTIPDEVLVRNPKPLSRIWEFAYVDARRLELTDVLGRLRVRVRRIVKVLSYKVASTITPEGSLAQIMDRLLLERGLNQRTLSVKSGVHRTQILKIRQGKRVSNEILSAVAEALGTSPLCLAPKNRVASK